MAATRKSDEKVSARCKSSQCHKKPILKCILDYGGQQEVLVQIGRQKTPHSSRTGEEAGSSTNLPTTQESSRRYAQDNKSSLPAGLQVLTLTAILLNYKRYFRHSSFFKSQQLFKSLTAKTLNNRISSLLLLSQVSQQ